MNYCPACVENGREVEATWRLPQSVDQGKTVTFVNACDSHHEWWWDGADWDGRNLERRINATETDSNQAGQRPRP